MAKKNCTKAVCGEQVRNLQLLPRNLKFSSKSSLPLRSAPYLCATGTRRPFIKGGGKSKRAAPFWPLSAESGIFYTPKTQERVKKTARWAVFEGKPTSGVSPHMCNRPVTKHLFNRLKKGSGSHSFGSRFLLYPGLFTVFFGSGFLSGCLFCSRLFGRSLFSGSCLCSRFFGSCGFCSRLFSGRLFRSGLL